MRQQNPGDSLKLARHCSQRMTSTILSSLVSGSFHSSCDVSAWGKVPEKRAHGWLGISIRFCFPGSHATASCLQPLRKHSHSSPGHNRLSNFSGPAAMHPVVRWDMQGDTQGFLRGGCPNSRPHGGLGRLALLPCHFVPHPG